MPTSLADTLDHPNCDPAVTWTTGNVAEAFPGVFTSFGFTFMHEPLELAFRVMFVQFGVFDRAELQVPARIEDQFWTVFAGRAAANIATMRRVANVMPGTSATAVEEQLFGYVRPGTVDQNSFRRYPAILVKAPRAVLTVPKRHDALFERLRQWRLGQLPRIPELDQDGCLDVLVDARARFQEIMREHLIVTFVGSALADRLTAMVKRADLAGLEARLLSGVGSDEGKIAQDLWLLAHDELDLGTFLDAHGYHGQNEGQLSGVSWREDPGPILARLDDYRAIPADSPRTPHRRVAEQAEVRRQAAAELAARTSPLGRLAIGRLVSLTARFLSLREQGKAGYLLTFDVARAAVRRLGEQLVARGILDDPDDVFHLSYDELRAKPTQPLQDIVAARRARYTQRLGQRLPQAWEGLPEVREVTEVPPDTAPSSGPGLGVTGLGGPGLVVTGVAASGGVIEGRARVVRDPATTDLDDGDVLVCETTDPSWVSLFLVAGAVVTDFGGMLSHGPIVARELGIPCVCGTEDGSRRIRDGQRLRVDGDRGVVEVLD